MPNVKKYRASRKKKLYKPRKRVNNKINAKTNKDFRATNSYGITPQPFPRVLFTQCKYSDSKIFTVPALGVSNANTYRSNSIWDPDFTGTGQTVAGWNVLNQIYGRYWVMGCKVRLTFSDPLQDGVRVGYSIRQRSNAPTAGLTIQQLAYYNNVYMSSISNSGSQKKVFNFYMKPWAQSSVSKLEYMANSDQHSAIMSGFPNIPSYFDVFVVNENVGSSATTINYTCEITYYVKLYDRLQLNPTSF